MGFLSSRAVELFQTQGYKTTTSCPIRDWKAKGYALEPAKRPVAGALR